uniref:Uncharacterized protein n=1 Tax=Anguilla anguilla TaxID=7936 RepID=A0A0E9PD99_ANGAN
MAEAMFSASASICMKYGKPQICT